MQKTRVCTCSQNPNPRPRHVSSLLRISVGGYGCLSHATGQTTQKTCAALNGDRRSLVLSRLVVCVKAAMFQMDACFRSLFVVKNLVFFSTGKPKSQMRPLLHSSVLLNLCRVNRYVCRRLCKLKFPSVLCRPRFMGSEKRNGGSSIV